MGDRQTSLFVVLLVALAGMFHVAPLATENPDSAAPAETKAATFDGPLPDPCRGDQMIADFRVTGPTASGKEHPAALVDALIVTVPDPIDSHIAFNCDERLEVIQRATEELKYVLDRYCLPWPRKQNKTTATGANDYRHHAVPGTMLFRKAGSSADRTQLLLIFLVGETPTAGVHKAALYDALNQASKFVAGKPLRIVGPSFSGSAISIGMTVRRWADEKGPVTAHIISSNATSSGIAKYLTVANARLRMNFHSVVWSDDEMRCAIFESLDEFGVPANRVLVLSESTSAYGHSSRRASSARLVGTRKDTGRPWDLNTVPRNAPRNASY